MEYLKHFKELYNLIPQEHGTQKVTQKKIIKSMYHDPHNVIVSQTKEI